MVDNPKDITPKILLEHMQGMKQELLKGQANLKTELTQRIDGVETNLTKQIDGLDQKLTVINTGVENIDNRLDEIEIEFLPKRINRVEDHLELPPLPATA